MSQLPPGTLGDAVGVLIYTFVCLIANILLIWLHWVTHQKLSYVTLIAYFALICTVSSIIQQIYNYTLWSDIMWAQLYYIKDNYENADVIFNNGNFGFMRVLAILRLFCYIMESSYLLSYSIQIAFSVYDFWSSRRRAERAFSLLSKIVPLILAGITIGLLQTPAVQSSFLVYMVVANVQAVTSCAVSIVLIGLILFKYVQTKRGFRNIGSALQSRRRRLLSGSKNSSSGTESSEHHHEARAPPRIFDDSWLVFRLSMAILLISLFIFASLVTHLPQKDDVARDAQAEEPDLSPERASSNITGYMYGVTPGLAIWIVFGLTKEFRQVMYDRFVPRKWRRKQSRSSSSLSRSPWSPSAGMRGSSQASGPQQVAPTTTVDVELQLDDWNRDTKKRATSDVFQIQPLLGGGQAAGPGRGV